LSGNITNGSGQPVEGALVTILNTDLTNETDEDGDYAFESVPVGKQAMTVQAAEFVTYTDDIVEIFEGQDTINDIDLTPEEPTP
jgi:protocatechuate 3,4-dioxygenase beta subunit